MDNYLNSKNWNIDPSLNNIPLQLNDFLKEVIEPLELKITSQPLREKESEEYGATILELENNKILFRVGKTTRTKIGQFVTLWKRSPIHGKIIPIDLYDNIDYVFIASFDKKHRGVFIFDKQILLQKKIFSSDKKGGKLGFRIYGPWIDTLVLQAKTTQKWQCKYFMSLNNNIKDFNIDSPLEAFQQLFNKVSKV